MGFRGKSGIAPAEISEEPTMGFMNAAALVLAVGLMVYLFVAMFRPEAFE